MAEKSLCQILRVLCVANTTTSIYIKGIPICLAEPSERGFCVMSPNVARSQDNAPLGCGEAPLFGGGWRTRRICGHGVILSGPWRHRTASGNDVSRTLPFSASGQSLSGVAGFPARTVRDRHLGNQSAEKPVIRMQSSAASCEQYPAATGGPPVVQGRPSGSSPSATGARPFGFLVSMPPCGVDAGLGAGPISFAHVAAGSLPCRRD